MNNLSPACAFLLNNQNNATYRADHLAEDSNEAKRQRRELASGGTWAGEVQISCEGSPTNSKNMSNASMSRAKPLNHLVRMTYPQVERLAGRTELALLPVGPAEAHGPHLPLGTDLIAACELCERGAQELAAQGVECLIAPLLPYCLAEVAEPFPGTITIQADIVAALVADICRSLIRSGFRRILVVSGHAEEENRAALQAGAEQVGFEGALVKVSRWYEDALPELLHLLEEDHPEHDIHAGEWETALVLLRASELVDRRALESLSPNWATRNISERRAAGARTFPELGAPEAYCGDPRRATPKTGESLYAALGEFIAEEGASLLRS